MRRCARIAVFMLCLPIPATVSADAFSDFRIPDHSWRSFGWDVFGSGSRNDVSSSSSQYDGSNSNVRLATAASWFRDAEHIRSSRYLSASAFGSWTRERSQSLTTGFDGIESFEDESRRTAPRDDLEGHIFGSTEWTLRPERRIWSYRIAARGMAEWSRRAGSSDLDRVYTTPSSQIRDLAQNSQISRTARYSARTDLGISVGRVRDATAIFTVENMLERLRADGLLEREPSADAHRRLAGIFYASGGFAVVHDQPRRFQWKEIEQVLQGDGALRESGFGAYDLLKVLEPIQVARNRFSRPVGFESGPIARYEHSHEIMRTTGTQFFERTIDGMVSGSSSSGYSDRLTSDQDAIRVGARAEWHRPLGLRTQVDAIAEAVFDVGEPEERWSESSRVSISRLVDERWFFTAVVVQSRDLDTEDYRVTRWATQCEVVAEYFLEDRWSLSARLVQYQSRVDYNPTSDPQFSRQSGVTLGLGFNRGAFDAPGLIEPVRPLN